MSFQNKTIFKLRRIHIWFLESIFDHKVLPFLYFDYYHTWDLFTFNLVQKILHWIFQPCYILTTNLHFNSYIYNVMRLITQIIFSKLEKPNLLFVIMTSKVILLKMLEFLVKIILLNFGICQMLLCKLL